MKIGIVKEQSQNEYRVALVPSTIQALSQQGHTILVEHNAGIQSGYPDSEYIENNAMVGNRQHVLSQAELIVAIDGSKICPFHTNQILLSYMALYQHQEILQTMIEKQCTAIALENLQPLQQAMQEIIGRTLVQIASQYFFQQGILLNSSHTLVIIGCNPDAARIALGIGMKVYMLDTHIEQLARIEERFQGRIKTSYNNIYNAKQALSQADLVIADTSYLPYMKPGSLLLTILETMHVQLSYKKQETIHTSIQDVFAHVPKTSSLVLSQILLPYIQQIANQGLNAILQIPELYESLLVCQGQITNKNLANKIGMDYISPKIII